MGWNNRRCRRSSRSTVSPAHERFYFVHSNRASRNFLTRLIRRRLAHPESDLGLHGDRLARPKTSAFFATQHPKSGMYPPRFRQIIRTA
jgi:imidazoleglycerol phosphate synthase glutamine amidotransferase subunit HisH